MFIKKLVKKLNQRSIPYSIVGGYAVVIHGVIRGTLDIDLVTSLTKENLKKIEQALNELGLQSRIPVRADEIYEFRKEYIKNKNLIAWNFVNPANPTEVVDILITKDLNHFKSQAISLQNTEIQVISKKDLIQMKKQSGRPQDLEDVKALESIP